MNQENLLAGEGGSSGHPETVLVYGQRKGDRISREDMFMEMAETLAKRSTCLRSKVGALIVNGGRVVSTGYNGPVSGAPLCQDAGGCLGAGCNRSIHAELNAILFAARAGISVDGCTLYCTMAPCLKCAQAIVNSGIIRVVYKTGYRDPSGVDFLYNNGVEIKQLYTMPEVQEWIPTGEGEGRCPHCGHIVKGYNRTICPYCFTLLGALTHGGGKG